MSTPRNQQPIDPLLRLQQLEQRRSKPLPPPSPRQAALAAPRPSAAPRQTAARPAAPRTAALPASGGVSAEASARLAALQASRAGNARPGPGRPGSKPVGKKAKPASGAKAASLLLSALATGGLAGMFAHNNAHTDSIVLTQGTLGTVATAPATAPATAATVATVPTTAAAGTAATVATTAAPTTAAAVKTVTDGTYVGASSSNRFGNVQVQAVYSGGQLVDVQILQYPNGDNRSVSINQYALPRLINEAVAAQSANVSSISGATYTSRSYVKSLQSAIDAAKAASGIG